MMKHPLLKAAAAALALSLAACGGGGGGTTAPGSGSGGTANAPANGACTPVAAAPVPGNAPPTGSVWVTGVAEAQIVPDDLSTGALSYGGTLCKPIRAAVVELLDGTGATILYSGKTDDSGNFALAAPANTQVEVRVKAQLVQTGSPNWSVAVRDNTNGNALYAVVTAAFNSTASNSVQNVTAGYGWSGSSYSSPRASAPFAILDTVYRAINEVLTASPTASFPTLNLFWSVNNAPSSGSISQGQIGTTYFTQDSQGNRSIYVLGKADTDTDEFDETVIAHEWGHYFQNVFSRDDSVGGQHSGGDMLDMRVAFSEGWGNAWSGMATNRSVYTDSKGPGQSNGFAVDLTAGALSPAGWYKESSIESVLFNFFLQQSKNFTPIWQAMTGPLKSGQAVSSIHAFGASLAATAGSSAAAVFNSYAAGQNITTSTDPLGGSETNSGGLGSNSTLGGPYAALPLYKPYTQGTAATVCLTNVNDSASSPDNNKLGEAQFLVFSVPGSRNYTVTVTGGSKPAFEVYQAPGGYLGSAYGSGTVALAAGSAVLVVEETDMANAGSPTPCYTVSVN